MAGSDKRILTIATSVAASMFSLVVLLGMYIQNGNGKRLDRLEDTDRGCSESIAGMSVRLEFIQRDLATVLKTVEAIQKKMSERL